MEKEASLSFRRKNHTPDYINRLYYYKYFKNLPDGISANGITF